MNDKIPIDNALNALKVIIEQNDVLIKYVADCRNILVALANKQGIKINPPENIATNYQPMDDLYA